MTGIIILAAGGSTRLGRPKQSLPFNGKSLLKHASEAALHSSAGPVLLVLGAESEILKTEIPDGVTGSVVNPEWQQGISTSIKTGVKYFLEYNNDLKNILIMLCDQPYVSSSLIHKLIKEKERSGKRIIASAYNNTLGVPALFDISCTPELLLLNGNEGAKKLFTRFHEQVSAVSFPEGSIDIDTLQDYENLCKNLVPTETSGQINIHTL